MAAAHFKGGSNRPSQARLRDRRAAVALEEPDRQLQRVGLVGLLVAAPWRREDRILSIPPNLKGAAAQKVAAKLVAAGLVKEIKAMTGAPA
jgi:hypothetical protein